MDIRIVIKIHDLIGIKQTGTPKELSEKLGISERSVYNYLNFMKKELDAPIFFSTYKQNYEYKGECKLNFKGK